MLVLTICGFLVLTVPVQLEAAYVPFGVSIKSSEGECEYDGEPCPCLPPREDDPEPISDLIKIITEGSEYLKNYTFVEEAILSLGVTGVGKSTAVQIMAGRLTNLQAVATVGGDLVIIDDDNLIGAGSSSKTFFPHLVTKNITNPPFILYFYDFPGFKDTRGSIPDIAANFFMTEVVKKVGKVKLLFFITYDGMKRENGRLRSLGNTATEFVKDVKAFEGSFGLVVNKVDERKSNNQFFSTASAYLRDYISELGNEIVHDTDNAKNTEQKLALAQEFLKQDLSGNYTNMWFIRTPDMCGSLNESAKMHQAEQGLMSLIENLEFSHVEENSFGFALSPETKEEIRRKHRPDITNEIAKAITNVTQILNTWYINTKLRHTSMNISTLADVLHNDKERLSTLIDSIVKTPGNLTDLLESFWMHVGQIFPTEFRELLNVQVQFLMFLDKAVGDSNNPDLQIITNELSNFEIQLSNFEVWYDFCSRVEAITLRQTFHQNRPPVPSDANTVNWLDYIKTHRITTVGLKEEAAALEMEKPEKMILGELLMFALKVPVVSCSSPSNKMTLIHGNFISLAEVLPAVRSACTGSIEVLHIYASHSIFLDSILNKVDIDYQIVMMAPYWIREENTQWELILTGENGLPYSPSKASDGASGTETYIAGTPGTSGCAGKAGSPGGYMFGAALDIQSPQSVLIKVDGGNGGPGQAGGSGGKGYERDSIWCLTDTYYDKPKCSFDRVVECKHAGRHGGNGGNGGNGGQGGPGGFEGQITIKIESTAGVETSVLHGSTGEIGLGGSGGNGGRVGQGYSCILNSCNSIPPQGKSDGRNGTPGTSGGSDSCKIESIRREKKIDEPIAVSLFQSIFSTTSHPATISFVSFLNSM